MPANVNDTECRRQSLGGWIGIPSATDCYPILTNCPQTNPEHRLLLPKTAFFGFAKRYREPKLAEGFQDIIKVDFEVSTQRLRHSCSYIT